MVPWKQRRCFAGGGGFKLNSGRAAHRKMAESYKLVVLGAGGVGKSALTTQLIANHFVDFYDPTIEDAYRKQMEIDDHVVVLDVLDTAGQEEYSALRDQYSRHGQGFLLVYSVIDRATYSAVEEFRESVYRSQDRDSGTDFIPMVLIGNKCDLESERQVATIEGANLAVKWGIPHLESSAKTRINVDEAFQEVVRVIRDRAKIDDPDHKKTKRKKRLNAKNCVVV